MNNTLKLTTVSAFALLSTACASTYLDDSMKAGVDDKDKYAASSDTKPDDSMRVGVNDDDKYMSNKDTDNMNKSTSKPMTSMVGGATMYSNKTIVENASSADNLTTLVSLVKQAELVETLSSDGPFTVFAPTNNAFSMLPTETVQMLTKNENKDKLAGVLKGHVVSGTVTSSDLMNALRGKTSYAATTVSGDTLTFYMMGDSIKVADENGSLATIETADVMQSNGVVHVVSSVLVPK